MKHTLVHTFHIDFEDVSTDFYILEDYQSPVTPPELTYQSKSFVYHSQTYPYK